MSRQDVRMHPSGTRPYTGAGRTAWFVSAVVLLVLACTLATALACAAGYLLSKPSRPIVHVSAEAARYASQALFTDERQMAAFRARLDALAAATGTSVVVTYVDRPHPGETLTAAMERSLDGLEATLAGQADGQTDGIERSTLVVVLMGKPRIFGFIGTDRARTRVFLRNLSGDPAVHSLNFKHIQVTHGRYLMQGLAIAEHALRPLHGLLEHHPAQGLVIGGLDIITGSVPDLPNDALLAIVRAVRAPLARLAADYGVPPILLLLGPLAILALLVDRVEKLSGKRLKRRPWLNMAVWIVCRTIPIPAAGIVAVVLYGSLENIASLAQMSGQPLLDLLHLSRGLPTPTIPAWVSWLAIPAAFVIALGVTVGIGLRLAGGDAHRLTAPGQWFSGWPWPLRVALMAIAVPAVLLPVPLMVALASMEGLMAVALLVTMLVPWGHDVYRFWSALAEEPAEAA